MRPAAAAYVAAAVVLTALAALLAFAPDRSGSLGFWMLAGAPSVVLALAALPWARSEGVLAGWMAPRWGDFTRGLLGAVALFALAWLFVHEVCPVGSRREIWLVTLYGQIGDPRTLQAHAPWVAAAILAVTLAEEIVWRGVVTERLAERVGSRRAWVWAAALYAVSYVPSVWALRSAAGLNPILVIAALGGGLVWGAMARSFGSLVPSVLAHALFDWAVLMMFPLWGSPLSRLGI